MGGATGRTLAKIGLTASGAVVGGVAGGPAGAMAGATAGTAAASLLDLGGDDNANPPALPPAPKTPSLGAALSSLGTMKQVQRRLSGPTLSGPLGVTSGPTPSILGG